jgi:REP element-mobilizing transposase RayT
MMAHSFTSINIHYVFSPLNRHIIESPEQRKNLNNYIGGICQNLNCQVLASYVMPDHVHLLVNIPGKLSVAELVQKVKANSSRHLNALPDSLCRFAWQEGYGAFSCSYSMLKTVVKYIHNQEEHHKS